MENKAEYGEEAFENDSYYSNIKPSPIEVAQRETAEEKTASEIFSKPNVVDIVMLVAASVALVLHAAIIIMLLAGAVEFLGSGVNLLSGIQLIISLFAMSSATVYKSLMSGAFGVVYFVVMVLVVRAFVLSLIRFVGITKKFKASSSEQRRNYIYVNVDSCISVFAVLCLLVISSNLLGASEITAMMVTIMVFCGILYVGRSVLTDITSPKNVDVWSMAVNAVKRSIIFVAICLLIKFFNQTMFKDFIYGLGTMFNGNVFSTEGGFVSSIFSLYSNIIEPLLFTVNAGIFAYVLWQYVYFIEGQHMYAAGKTKTLIILTGVNIGLNLIFKCLMLAASQSFSFSMFIEWLGTLRYTYLPIILLEAVFCVITMIHIDSPGKSATLTPATAIAAE